MTRETHTPQAAPIAVDRLLADAGTGIIVCCGSGGVGKRTRFCAEGTE